MMGLSAYKLLLALLATCVINSVFAKPKPRDSSAAHVQSIVPIGNGDWSQKVDATGNSKSSSSSPAEVPNHFRISCDFEEAVEDIVCLEHCLPKGYTYGLCVSHTCSCI